MQLTEYSSTKQALGGAITLTVVSDMSRLAADELFVSLWREVIYFEKRFSRFLPSSELSRFNAKAGIRVPISAEFMAILQAAKLWAQKTSDLYNPFILPALHRAGYVQSAVKGYQHDKSPDYTNRYVVAGEQLELGDDWALIPRDSAIDLGGMGKGYLADQLGERLRTLGVAGYWLELSGDIATYGHTVDNQPIHVAIQNARDITKKHTDIMVECPETPFAVATSGTFRRGTHNVKDIEHHIIDPRSGKSAQTDVLLATVCAESALAADVVASCGVIVGADNCAALFKRFQLPAWLVQYRQHEGKIIDKKHGNQIIGVAI